MYETLEGYVFETFADGKAVFYKDSYKKHCGYRDVIRGEQGREDIQNALINPDIITSYMEKSVSGRIIARCKIYRSIVRVIKTSRGRELEYWEIILKKKPGKKRKIVTAYPTSAPKYAIINNRIETIEYEKQNKKK